MASQLSTFPTEVVEIIAHMLDLPSLCAVRLTCKEMKRKTSHHFGVTYFSTLETDWTLEHLQKLQLVARNELLMHHVRALVIHGHHDIFGKSEYIEEFGERPGRVETRRTDGIQILRVLLSKIVNCKSFQIRGIGELEGEFSPKCLLPSDAIGIIFETVAEHRLPIKSFQICFGSGNVEAQRMQIYRCEQSTFLAAWENLEELSLEHGLTEKTVDWARNLVLHTENLKKLSLQLGYVHSSTFIEGLLTSASHLQNIQEFELARMEVSADMLSKLLLRSRPSLRMLSLRLVFTNSGTWVEVLTKLMTFPLLDTIVFQCLCQSAGTDNVGVTFPALTDDPVVPGSGGQKFQLTYPHKQKPWTFEEVSFKGRSGMKMALQTLSELAVCD